MHHLDGSAPNRLEGNKQPVVRRQDGTLLICSRLRWLLKASWSAAAVASSHSPCRTSTKQHQHHLSCRHPPGSQIGCVPCMDIASGPCRTRTELCQQSLPCRSPATQPFDGAMDKRSEVIQIFKYSLAASCTDTSHILQRTPPPAQSQHAELCQAECPQSGS